MTSWKLDNAVALKWTIYTLIAIIVLIGATSTPVQLLFAAVTTAPVAPPATNLTPLIPATALTAKATETSTEKSTTTSTVVDITQDVKAMGYPDGRKLIRDRMGNLYVAYRKKYKLHQLTAYHIFVAKSTDNGATWQILNRGQPIEAVGDYNQRVPAIAIDSKQIVHVVWYGKDAQHNKSDENQIKYTRSSDGGATWSTWQNVAPVSGYSNQPFWQEHPTIYIDSADALYVAWEGRDAHYTNTSQVKLIQSTDGGFHWSTWINVMPDQNNRSRPTLVATVQGELYLFAYGRMGATQQILYTRSTDGGQRWRAWSQVAPSRQDQRHVSVDTDRQGALHVVWRQAPDQLFGSGNAQIHYAQLKGERWSVPLLVAPDVSAAQTFPSIGIDQQDALWIAWSATTTSYDFPNDAPERGTIYYVVKTDAGWSERRVLTTGGDDIYASLGRRNAVGSGAMGLIWLENTDAIKQIRFATLAAPTYFTAAPQLVRAGLFGAINLASLRTLLHAPAPFPLFGSSQLTRELASLLLICLIVTLYVVTKSLVTRRRHLPISSSER